mmetsp:Transcript_29857/g.41296  ORF Transcript_29857/g.41296 Transcript_29857/m.41296 type:complete len:291 (-) Transcript_29857:207-1079(-)|eukprot:CAMPEP_0196583188 /NCGR_PEP_ID=MMETSP1081-20130531/42474_1 /TAXON_ID=36882 /ORGANISM="Pyramimonas amylifera, Strain CCMP720" /LENGTH=290 /DNA_ID=CAMNT_0041903999 /DNA_START=81 /DNA_END=953 /DNA_ORIENTATION=+
MGLEDKVMPGKLITAPKLHIATFKKAGIDFTASKYTVLVYFRGSWCPSCRAQLREMENACAELKAQGVALHAITAEPDSEEVLRARLLKKEVPDLSFKLHSDPEHRLLGDPYDFYTIMDMPASFFKEDYQNFTMVNPALLLVDNVGKAVLWWSWKTSGFDPGWQPVNVDMDKLSKFGLIDQMLNIAAQTSEVVSDPSTGCSGLLTRMRPVIEDVLPAFMEGRPVKLHVVTVLSTDKKIPPIAKPYVALKAFVGSFFSLLYFILIKAPVEWFNKVIGNSINYDNLASKRNS